MEAIDADPRIKTPETPGYEQMPSYLCVKPVNEIVGDGLFAAENIRTGAMVLEFIGEDVLQKIAHPMSIQATSEYARLTLPAIHGRLFENYPNHECIPPSGAEGCLKPNGKPYGPNCDLRYVPSDKFYPNGEIVYHIQLVANRDISEGEAISFFYPDSETNMSEQGCDFECLCDTCLKFGQKKVTGFDGLTMEEKERRFNERKLAPHNERKYLRQREQIVSFDKLPKSEKLKRVRDKRLPAVVYEHFFSTLMVEA